MTLSTLIRERLAFDKETSRQSVRDIYRSFFNGDPPFKSEVDQGLKCMEMENARLQPILTQLIACVEAGESVIQTHGENGPIESADISTLKEALAALRDSLGEI